MNFLDEFLWAILGLLLTIAGTFMEAAIAIPTFMTGESGMELPTSLSAIPVYSLPVSYQVAAVLLVGCMGGRQAAALSQIAYLVLGLSGFQVFSQGGGLGYWQEPTFGYLIGFIPGAWICGWLAVPKPPEDKNAPRPSPRLEWLVLSCLAGLLAIHLCGLLYLAGLGIAGKLPLPFVELAQQYSLFPLPGQLVIVCIIAFFSRVLRFVLIY
ncbi:biotin transporter BioY [Candidatus Synechococcus calcipolaris G9]|uniref:Biotin transporter BioY n=1 Tax=Candidatus Synechococcus calcipolaris G9 TaxID=1497997 RepID=A0ABT6F123_9SYNE|nr:biotin transporter BioY [Candidatus Synechococcus calcipolaris]MDG2991554.1 biotin transporter BioY [Candidatus Synechococcus calcipolaris G9]